MSKLFGDLEIRSNKKLKLLEGGGGANFVSLKSPASMSADLELVLPSSDSASGVLKSDGSGNLSIAKIVDANVDSAAAIAYSKLSLSGSIVNADINASAAIAYSKLSLSGSIVNADVSASAAIAESKLSLDYSTSSLNTAIGGKASKSGDTFTGDIIMDNEKLIKFREATGNGTNFVAFKAPASLAADTTYTLPSADGTGGYVLSTDGSGNLSWVSNSSTISYATDWATGDGTTKAVSHSLGSKDVLVHVYDKTDDRTIEVDSIVRTDTNTVTLVSSEAPGASSWRVLVVKA